MIIHHVTHLQYIPYFLFALLGLCDNFDQNYVINSMRPSATYMGQ